MGYSFHARLIASTLGLGLAFAACSSHQETLLPGTAGPGSAARTPQSLGLGNQQWTSCNNVPSGDGGLHEASRQREEHKRQDDANHHSGRGEVCGHGGDNGDGGDDENSSGSSNCSGISLIAPLNTIVTTDPSNPNSTTANVKFAFSLSAGVCSPVHIGGNAPTPSPSPTATPGEGDNRREDAVLRGAWTFPLGATPIALTSEVTSYLGRLTINDPCPVSAPLGLPATASATSVQPGYYIVLLSQNAAGNFGIAGAMSLVSASGQALTFAPQQNALIDLPQGFSYAFYLAQTSAVNLIQLPNGINGAFN